jgi:hypothetical protein
MFRMAQRIDHEAMRRASELPTSGDGATDTLAASGGLELPGREPHSSDAASPEHRHEPIPGEHDHTTEAATSPAIVGTTGYGIDLPVTNEDSTVDEETARRSRWEGGGKIVPRLGPDTEAHPGERKPDEEKP